MTERQALLGINSTQKVRGMPFSESDYGKQGSKSWDEENRRGEK